MLIAPVEGRHGVDGGRGVASGGATMNERRRRDRGRRRARHRPPEQDGPGRREARHPVRERRRRPRDVRFGLRVVVGCERVLYPYVEPGTEYLPQAVGREVQVEWIEAKSIDAAEIGELAVSRLGTLAAARVTAPDSEPIVCVSLYSPWTTPHASTKSSDIVSDASAHRILSDLSAFIGRRRGHRIVAAGDLNVLYGHGEHGDAYWAGRYETVFTRMKALGLPFVGPQAPNGRQADPWPDELPRNSRNVPTYHTTRQTSATATRQLDFVFASEVLADSLTVRALNAPDQWGPSDHCCVEIEIA